MNVWIGVDWLRMGSSADKLLWWSWCSIEFNKKISFYQLNNHLFFKEISAPVCRRLFAPVTHPNLSKIHDGTTKFRLTERGHRTIHDHKYVSTVHINACPIRMQAYGNKTHHVWNKTVDAEWVFIFIPCIYCELQLWKMLTDYSLIEKHCAKRHFQVLFK